MKRFLGLAGRGLAILALVFTIDSRCEAARVTSISATGTGFTLLGSSTFNNTSNTITLNMEANSIGGLPTNVRFDLAKDSSPFLTRTYSVTLNVTNLVPLGRSIGLDMVHGLFGNAGYSHSLGVVTDTDGLTHELGNGFNLPGGHRFGGLSGGGTLLANGDTATIKFDYDLINNGAAGGTGFASLNFTANPEPTTLLLGSLAMIPAAVVARRRRKAASELIEA